MLRNVVITAAAAVALSTVVVAPAVAGGGEKPLPPSGSLVKPGVYRSPQGHTVVITGPAVHVFTVDPAASTANAGACSGDASACLDALDPSVPYDVTAGR